jgi:hypothetical protein
MVPKHTSSDAGNLDILDRSIKCFLLSKRVKVLDLRKEKKEPIS